MLKGTNIYQPVYKLTAIRKYTHVILETPLIYLNAKQQGFLNSEIKLSATAADAILSVRGGTPLKHKESKVPIRYRVLSCGEKPSLSCRELIIRQFNMVIKKMAYF